MNNNQAAYNEQLEKLFNENELIAYFDDKRESSIKNNDKYKERTSKTLFESTILCNDNVFEFKHLSRTINSLDNFQQNFINSIYDLPDKEFIKKLSSNYISFESSSILKNPIYSIKKQACKALNKVVNHYGTKQQIFIAASEFYKIVQKKFEEQEESSFKKLDEKQKRFEELFYLCFRQYASKRNQCIKYKDINFILNKAGFNASLKHSKGTRKKFEEYRGIIEKIHMDILNKIYFSMQK